MKNLRSSLLYFYLFFLSLSFGTLKAESDEKKFNENYQNLFTAYQLFFIQSWQDPKAFQAASYVKTHLSTQQQSSCLNRRDDVCTIYFEENDLKYCDDLLKSWNYFSLVLDNNDKAYLNSKQSSHSLNLYSLTYSMERCADSGHLRSILALGKGNFNGTHDTEKNLLAAEYWFRFLISTAPQTKESYKSAYFLGLILDEKDKEGALQWMEWAARKGNKSAWKWLIQSPNPNAYFAYIKIKDDRGENSLPFYKILYQNLHNKESSKNLDEIKDDIIKHKDISWDRRQRIQDIPLQKKELSEKANSLDIIRRLSEALQKKDYELNAMTRAHLLHSLIYFHNDAETLLGYNKSDAHSFQDFILKDIEDSLEKKRLSQGSSADDKRSSYYLSKDKELKRVLEFISLGYKSHEKHKSHDSNYMEKLTKALYSLYGDYRNAPESFFDALLESMDKTKNPRVLLTLLPDLLRGDLEKLDNLIKARDLFVSIQGENNQNNDGLIEIELSIDILSSLGNLASEAPELCQKNTIVELPSSFQKLQGLLCSKDKRDILRHFLLQGQSHENSGLEINFMNLPENVQEALGILGKWAAVKSHKQKTGFYKLSRALKMGFSKEGAKDVHENLEKENQRLEKALHDEFNSEKAQCLTEEGIERQESLTKRIDLKYKALSLLDYINHYVLPFVDLYYDKDEITFAVRVKLRESESEFLSFTKPSYRHNYRELGLDLFLLSTALYDTLTLVNFGDNRQTDFVFLRIPKPGGESEQSPDNTVHPSIDSARAKIFWDHLFSEENKPPIAIHLHPSDLYRQNTQALSKNEVSPLILDMMLIFSYDDAWVHDSTVNDIKDLGVDFNAGPSFLMALEDGPEVFTLEGGSRNVFMGVGFNKQNDFFTDAIRRIESENRQGVNASYGLSPFTQFQIVPESSSSLHFLKDKLSSDSNGYPQDVTDAWLVFKIFAKNKKKNGISWLEDNHDH